MSRPLDPAYVFDQYEAIRREALAGNPYGCRGHGLALFLSRGMSAWLAALSILDRHQGQHHDAEDLRPPRAPELPAEARSELTLVWAGMVLACVQETAV